MGEIIECIHSFLNATVIYCVLNCSRHCARHGGDISRHTDPALKAVSSSPGGRVMQKFKCSFSLTPPWP